MNKKNLTNLIRQDKQLITLFSCMVISLMFLVSLLVTAGIWYL